MNVRFTLVAEGSTDVALLPILKWAVQSDPRVMRVEANFADPGMLPPVRKGLNMRILRAVNLFPANLVFVHRDADRGPAEVRRNEIRRAALPGQLTVPVVPVRMTEAWLLIDEEAIRSAAGNPRGAVGLGLPRLGAIEGIANPKDILFRALREASELHGRRLRKFSETAAASLVAERIGDFSPLLELAAFREFRSFLSEALDSLQASQMG